MSMDMSQQMHQPNMKKQASFNEFDPLSGGGQRRPSSNNNNNNNNNNDIFGSDFSSSNNRSVPVASQPLQPQRVMNVSQAFGTVGQQQQQQQQQQNMAGLGHQVFQMGISTPQNPNKQQQQSSKNNSFEDDSFFGSSTNANGNGGEDPFGNSEDFSSSGGFDDFGSGGNGNGNGNGNSNKGGGSSGFDMDDMMAQADAKEAEKEKKRQRKSEKLRKKREEDRRVQEEADRKLAMQLHAEENTRGGTGVSGGGGGATGGGGQRVEQQLPGGWTRDHRGNLQGRVFERVTTKLIGHKWSPRSMMITSEQIVLRKIEAEKRGQQRSFPITEYTTVGAAYINPEQSHAMIDVDGTFLSFSLFFLVIE